MEKTETFLKDSVDLFLNAYYARVEEGRKLRQELEEARNAIRQREQQVLQERTSKEEVEESLRKQTDVNHDLAKRYDQLTNQVASIQTEVGQHRIQQDLITDIEEKHKACQKQLDSVQKRLAECRSRVFVDNPSDPDSWPNEMQRILGSHVENARKELHKQIKEAASIHKDCDEAEKNLELLIEELSRCKLLENFHRQIGEDFREGLLSLVSGVQE